MRATLVSARKRRLYRPVSGSRTAWSRSCTCSASASAIFCCSASFRRCDSRMRSSSAWLSVASRRRSDLGALLRLARAVAVVTRDRVLVRDLRGDEAGARAAADERLVQPLRLAQVAQRGAGVVQALADVGGHLQQAHARVRRILQLGGFAALAMRAWMIWRASARGGPSPSGRCACARAKSVLPSWSVNVGRQAAVQPFARAFEVAGAQVRDRHQRRVVGEHARRACGPRCGGCARAARRTAPPGPRPS